MIDYSACYWANPFHNMQSNFSCWWSTCYRNCKHVGYWESFSSAMVNCYSKCKGGQTRSVIQFAIIIMIMTDCWYTAETLCSNNILLLIVRIQAEPPTVWFISRKKCALVLISWPTLKAKYCQCVTVKVTPCHSRTTVGNTLLVVLHCP